MDMLNKMNEHGTTIIMVTHDKAIASHAHRAIHLLDGHIDRIQTNGHSKTLSSASKNQ